MTIPRWFTEQRRIELKTFAARSRQVVLAAAAVGALTGLFVAGFERLVVTGAFDHVLEAPLWAIAVLPMFGLLASFLLRRFVGGGVSSASADEYLRSFHEPDHSLGLRGAVARTLAAVATLGAGGPMGLEGPSLYGGATIGYHLQRRFPRVFRDADRRVLLVAGAGAGVAAIFKAPATGAVFALEVPYHDDLARSMLLPALVSSACSYLVFVAINGTSPLFPVSGTLGLSYRDLIGAAVLGAVAGLGARAFAWMLRRAKAIGASDRPALAAIAAGLVIAALFVIGRGLTGESLIVGPGYEVLSWATDPGRSIGILLAVLVLRCLATSATVAGGGVGGLFIPLVVAGALSGAAVGGAVHRGDLTLFIVVGVAAFLGAGYRVPLAAVMFVAETTGRPSFIVPGLIAAVAAELMMGSSSVTDYQRTTALAAADISSPEASPGRPDPASPPSTGEPT
jgi:CIC family chloride channel protein